MAVGPSELTGASADSPWGLPELRERVAAGLGRIGLPTSVDQVVITTGAQQGISIAAGCWLRPGDVVVVDDPTYPGALSAFAAAGAEVRPVPVDRHGVVLAELEAALASRPALVYLQSGPHSPTGARLSAHRRTVIAGWLDAQRIPLVEDLALESVDWSGLAPPVPIAGHAPDHPAAVVGSFSKQFWAGLRVGFVRAPVPVAARPGAGEGHSRPRVVHRRPAMALALLGHRDHDRSLARRNAELGPPVRAAGRPPGRGAAVVAGRVPTGGLSLWIRLPAPVAARFAGAALRAGVAVATADSLSATTAHRDRLRLTFAAPRSRPPPRRHPPRHRLDRLHPLTGFPPDFGSPVHRWGAQVTRRAWGGRSR